MNRDRTRNIFCTPEQRLADFVSVPCTCAHTTVGNGLCTRASLPSKQKGHPPKIHSSRLRTTGSSLLNEWSLGERKSVFLAQPAVHSVRMPLVGYLFSVGIALFLGLVSLRSYLEAGPGSAAKLSTAPTTASLVAGVPAKN